MKKRIFHKERKMPKFLNKLGMTYVELLCALSLLSLIVVMFTPMLLSSYETLYIAGEKVEGVYDSKEQMETGLASRYSVINAEFGNFQLVENVETNAQLLFESLDVTGKKVVSSLEVGLETVFARGRASLDIISPKIVYDDQNNHDVVIQTTGLEYNRVYFGSYSDSYPGDDDETGDQQFAKAVKDYKEANNDKGFIFIEVIIPDKTRNISNNTTTESSSYLSTNLATLKTKSGTLIGSDGLAISNNSKSGRIEFNISGTSDRELDFTQTPIRIRAYYVNNRGKTKSVCDYLQIDPPTIMLAGGTNKGKNIDYYTTAGVVESKENKGVYTLDVAARKMRVDTSGLFAATDTPSQKGVSIKTITWVEGDENSRLKPYYVMAGTNSSVYRMYNYRVRTNMSEVFGTDTTVNGVTNAVNTNEASLKLNDGSLAHPSFWSGEMSDQYYFLTQEEGNGYGSTPDNQKDCSEETDYDIFDKTLKYSMLFSGFNAGYTYHHQANRRISYVLTEAGNHSFRLGGKKMEVGDFAGYTAIWEPDSETFIGNAKTLGVWTSFYNESANVCYAHNDDTFNPSDIASGNRHYDKHLAYIRLKVYTNVNPMSYAKGSTVYDNNIDKGDFWFPKNSDSEADLGSCAPNTDYSWLSNHQNNVNISSAAYLPGSSSGGKGQVIYLGTTPGYAFLRLSSDITEFQEEYWSFGTKYRKIGVRVYNNGSIIPSTATCYIINGTAGVGTTLYKGYSTTSDDTKAVSNKLRDAMYRDIDSDTGNDVPSANGATYEFYNWCIDDVYKYDETDLAFTFGYCSRWRTAIGDVTHNGAEEETKSYEKYYVNSQFAGSYDHYQKEPGLNAGDESNLYYNVWFPGEFYNLTKVATCDAVTVAVGYAVSGSSYMKQSVVTNGKWGVGVDNEGQPYYGTALGSVYNDAVMAAYVSEEAGGKVFKDGEKHNGKDIELTDKGEQNSIFQNVLYYKMPTFKHRELHSRENIRFTAVDLFTISPQQVASGTKKYYAVYGDSNGKVYYSEIATSTVTGKEEYVTDDVGNKVDKDGDGEYDKQFVGEESEVKLRTGSKEKGDPGALSPSEMIEIKLNAGTENAKSLSEYFTEITTIVAEDNIILISGKPVGTTAENKYENIVVIWPDENGNWFDADGNPLNCEIVRNGTFEGYINEAKVIGDFYYIVGGEEKSGSANDQGWVAAIRTDKLIEIAKSSDKKIYTSSNNNTTDDKGLNRLIFSYTDTVLYSLDGRVTSG